MQRSLRRWAKLAGLLLAAGMAAATLVPGDAAAAARTRFWNLTTGTIKEFRLAPAGTTTFGKNQCLNDKDGTVDADERLDIVGVPSGRYDAKVVSTSGKACMAKNFEVKEGKIFSLDDHDLKGCKP